MKISIWIYEQLNQKDFEKNSLKYFEKNSGWIICDIEFVYEIYCCLKKSLFQYKLEHFLKENLLREERFVILQVFESSNKENKSYKNSTFQITIEILDMTDFALPSIVGLRQNLSVGAVLLGMMSPVFWIGRVIGWNAQLFVRELAQIRHVPMTLKPFEIVYGLSREYWMIGLFSQRYSPHGLRVYDFRVGYFNCFKMFFFQYFMR